METTQLTTPGAYPGLNVTLHDGGILEIVIDNQKDGMLWIGGMIIYVKILYYF